jgi:hypothetical protein
MNLTTKDTIMSHPGRRDYELDIIVGDLYEVWLQHDWAEPKPCVPVVNEPALAPVPGAPDWQILVDGHLREIQSEQIFRIGTATRPDSPFVMPIIKNVPAPLFINDIINVQPMTMPVSSIFYMDYKFGKEEE